MAKGREGVILVPCAVDLVDDRMNMNWSQRIMLAPPGFALHVLVPRGARVDVELPGNVTLRRARIPGKLGYLICAAVAMLSARLRGIEAVLTERSAMTLVAWWCRRLGRFAWIVDIWDLPEKALVTHYVDDRGFATALRRVVSHLKVTMFGAAVRAADLVICSIVPEALDRYRVPSSRLHTFRNALCLHETQAEHPERRDLRSICFVTNRFFSDRRLDLLIDAVSRLGLDHGIDVTVTLAGELPASVRQEIESSPVASRFRVLGRVRMSDAHRLMASSEVGVLPVSANRDLANIYPVKLLEYMALGSVVVASDLPGVREVVEHERHALLVPPDDPQALADSLIRVFADDALRERLRAAAGAEVQRYDARHKVASIYALVGALIHRHRSSRSGLGHAESGNS